MMGLGGALRSLACLCGFVAVFCFLILFMVYFGSTLTVSSCVLTYNGLINKFVFFCVFFIINLYLTVSFLPELTSCLLFF